MPKPIFCQAQVEDRIIFFELEHVHLYGSHEELKDVTIPIHWEDNGQVIMGELAWEDINSLDFRPEAENYAGRTVPEHLPCWECPS